MLAKLNITDALGGSKHSSRQATATEVEREEEEFQKARIEELRKRVKILLKEPENKKCSECRSNKPKWISLIQTPLDYNTQQVWVFCCNDCQPFHLALGSDLCTLKSLKHPEECK